MDRGIVITPSFTFDGSTLHFPGLVGIEPINLKHYLLYWDKIEYPNNNIIHIGTSPDEQFLIDTGILTRSNITFSGFNINVGQAYILAQIIAFQKKSEQEPGVWSISQISNNLFIPHELSTKEKTIEIELYKTLPSPSDDVSFECILDFKEKRKSELQAFRNLLDEMYLEIISSADIPRSKTKTIERLENAIKDLHSVSSESWTSKLLSGFKVELNIPSLAGQAIVGAGVASKFGFSPVLGAAIGAVGAAIKFEYVVSPKTQKIPNNLKDYAYLHYMENELL